MTTVMYFAFGCIACPDLSGWLEACSCIQNKSPLPILDFDNLFFTCNLVQDTMYTHGIATVVNCFQIIQNIKCILLINSP